MTDNKDRKRKNSHNVFLNGGNYTREIKGDFIQGDVVSYGPSPTPTPECKDLSKDGDAIDVESKEV